MAPATVLMYHAIGEADVPGADPHYSVPLRDFRAHLQAIAAAGARPSSVTAMLAGGAAGKVGITFDDGHESNAEAARLVAEAGGSADFLVNPARVGQRHFLDWPALRDMAAAGHAIQSHGQSHRYMDELDEAGIERELAESKAAIEDAIGAPVTLFAPPGGRLQACVAPIARRLGYRALCHSRPGLWRDASDPWDIPRFAVLAGTGQAQLARWVRGDGVEMAGLAARHALLSAAKRALGNRGYERVRGMLLGRRES
jgi:peptidoglycan/xylan/chitin deacetylase (PgdA/CDA1 family)